VGGVTLYLRMEITYQTKKGLEITLDSEELPMEDAMKVAEDLEKTGRMKLLLFIDEQNTNWTYKQLTKFLEEMKTEPHNITVYFDGGFDRNTRKAGLGCAIYYEQDGENYRIRKNAHIEGVFNNNEAECAALHFALKELEVLGVHHQPITVIGDSKVVIHQLEDEWPVYDQDVSNWLDWIEEKIEKLGITVTYKEVSRKLNKEADQLATQALEGIEISSHSKQ